MSTGKPSAEQRRRRLETRRLIHEWLRDHGEITPRGEWISRCPLCGARVFGDRRLVLIVDAVTGELAVTCRLCAKRAGRPPAASDPRLQREHDDE